MERDKPFSFMLGEGQVIAGLELGVARMKTGVKGKLTIPLGLACGQDGFRRDVPPNSTLVFEAGLLGIA